jgi:hypothetical protein
VRRQAISISYALRRVALTHSEGDAQQLLAQMRAFAIALNTPNSPSQLPADSQAAQERAIALYPDLGVANSALNREFVARYRQYRIQNPEYFTDPDWPTKLAKESAEALDQH